MMCNWAPKVLSACSTSRHVDGIPASLAVCAALQLSGSAARQQAAAPQKSAMYATTQHRMTLQTSVRSCTQRLRRRKAYAMALRVHSKFTSKVTPQITAVAGLGGPSNPNCFGAAAMNCAAARRSQTVDSAERKAKSEASWHISASAHKLLECWIKITFRLAILLLSEEVIYSRVAS
jgi:hypothetical protein